MINKILDNFCPEMEIKIKNFVGKNVFSLCTFTQRYTTYQKEVRKINKGNEIHS